MRQLNITTRNIVKENAELIHRAVLAVASDEYIPDLEKLLADAESNGWTHLVAAIRRILEGERDLSQQSGLDEEDRAIVSAILHGIEDPTSLPDLAHVIDPAIAGPSMANMIHDASTGNAAARDAIRVVGQQMSGTVGDFSMIPAAINLMVAGERREDVLCKGMGAVGTSLVQAILEDLNKLEG